MKVKESRHTVVRCSDEPKLEVGGLIAIKEGVTGIVLARFTPSGKTIEIHYLVEAVWREQARPAATTPNSGGNLDQTRRPPND
jgi:hypothetical protein